MIDLIGDIHGHTDKLEQLLLKLGSAKCENFEKVIQREKNVCHYPAEIVKYHFPDVRNYDRVGSMKLMNLAHNVRFLSCGIQLENLPDTQI